MAYGYPAAVLGVSPWSPRTDKLLGTFELGRTGQGLGVKYVSFPVQPKSLDSASVKYRQTKPDCLPRPAAAPWAVIG
jgi:hypothetical protein